MLEEALEHLVTGIVDHKDDVAVRRKELRRGEVRIAPHYRHQAPLGNRQIEALGINARDGLTYPIG